MTVGLSKPAALAVALACALVGAVAHADTSASTAKRVIVFDLQSDVSGQEVTQLPDLIEQLVASHAGYQATPDAEMHQALSKVSAKRPDCSVMDACRKQVASEVRADLIVSGSFAKQGKEYILYLVLDEVKGAIAPVRTSEPMKQLKSLQSNVTLCLERLFHWVSSQCPSGRHEKTHPHRGHPSDSGGARGTCASTFASRTHADQGREVVPPVAGAALHRARSGLR